MRSCARRAASRRPGSPPVAGDRRRGARRPAPAPPRPSPARPSPPRGRPGSAGCPARQPTASKALHTCSTPGGSRSKRTSDSARRRACRKWRATSVSRACLRGSTDSSGVPTRSPRRLLTSTKTTVGPSRATRSISPARQRKLRSTMVYPRARSSSAASSSPRLPSSPRPSTGGDTTRRAEASQHTRRSRAEGCGAARGTAASVVGIVPRWQQVVDGQRDVRKRRQRDRLAVARDVNDRVATFSNDRMRGDHDVIALTAHDPVLGHASRRVDPGLRQTILDQRRVGHLDDEMRGVRVAAQVVRPRPRDDEHVRLGNRTPPGDEWTLLGHQRARSERGDQRIENPAHAAGVPRGLRLPSDDDPLEQLDAIIRLEHALLDQREVPLGGQAGWYVAGERLVAHAVEDSAVADRAAISSIGSGRRRKCRNAAPYGAGRTGTSWTDSPGAGPTTRTLRPASKVAVTPGLVSTTNPPG